MDAFVNGFAAFLEDNEEAIAEIRSEMEQMRPKLIEPMESNQEDLKTSWLPWKEICGLRYHFQ